MDLILRLARLTISFGSRKFADTLVNSPAFHAVVRRTNRKLEELSTRITVPNPFAGQAAKQQTGPLAGPPLEPSPLRKWLQTARYRALVFYRGVLERRQQQAALLWRDLGKK